ncbi:50S ribosomal protein L33 [Stratiformator vulcanicus]|uniref:Large ribosomal subunit protein bL33 n=2 Tax=Stratiformator vulcanicus TaxID=2527980 RepID=A0A517R0G6_9PLAN|nr:50S ribosomal protein L33 [Stratiformator vulcanicus]
MNRGGPFGIFIEPSGTQSRIEAMAREYVWLQCTESNHLNYRVEKEMRGTERLELKKYCKFCRKHVPHKESRKK